MKKHKPIWIVQIRFKSGSPARIWNLPKEVLVIALWDLLITWLLRLGSRRPSLYSSGHDSCFYKISLAIQIQTIEALVGQKWPESGSLDLKRSLKSNIPAIRNLWHLHRQRFTGRLRRWFCRYPARRTHSWCRALSRWSSPGCWWCRRCAYAPRPVRGCISPGTVGPWLASHRGTRTCDTTPLDFSPSCCRLRSLSLRRTSLKLGMPAHMVLPRGPPSYLTRSRFRQRSGSATFRKHCF